MVKTYRTETRDTVIGKMKYYLIKSAGSTIDNENGEVEVGYCCHCGDIVAGISIGGVVFNKEDILEIAKRIENGY